MDSIPHKRCVTCGAEKPLSEFHKCKSKPDGLWVTCKVCACARANAWRKRNPKRDSEIQKGTRARRKAKGIKYEAPTSGTKYCNGCRTDKPVADFYADRNDPSGLRYRCAACSRLEINEYNNRNRDHRREMQRAYVRKHGRKVNKDARYYELRRAATRRYNERYPDKRRERVMRRNARKKQTSIGPVSYEAIWVRDCGVCYLCGLAIDRLDCHFDHVIPLAKGGTHTMDNIRATHSKCNQSKNDKLITE